MGHNETRAGSNVHKSSSEGTHGTNEHQLSRASAKDPDRLYREQKTGGLEGKQVSRVSMRYCRD